MKKLYMLLAAALITTATQAQITITASDMPVNGDTLRYSLSATTTSSVNLNDTGANKTWAYTFTPIAQRVDEYKTATKVNITYGLTISPTAYGYKVADTFAPPGMSLPINITEVYNFFNKKSGPSRFVTEAFAAKISGVPIPANYSDEDEVYFFPLAYGNEDSSDFFLNVAIPTVGSIKLDGYRKTKVDGWGTITTPYYTTPQNCIRVRSEIVEVDSFQVSSLPAIGIPRRTREYKWLINGEHYPALWITTTVVANIETITAVRYRDKYRSLSVADRSAAVSSLSIYPNPATDAVYITIPKGEVQYVVEVFDMQGKRVATQYNSSVINTGDLPAGNYIIRASFDDGIATAQFVKE